MTGQAFPKRERIYLRDELRLLFAAKDGFVSYPLRVLVLEKAKDSESEPRVKVLISVPKRRFKRAVDRNLLKRRFREAYRLQKVGFIEQLGALDQSQERQLLMGFIYISDEVATYKEMEAAVAKAFRKYLQKQAEILQQIDDDGATEKDI